MTASDYSRVYGSRSRACDKTEMIGVKWMAKRHGDLRQRLRAAVRDGGHESYADWLVAVLDERDALRANALRHQAHPLSNILISPVPQQISSSV